VASASNTPTDADHHRFRAGIAYAQRLSATPLETFVPEFETLLRLGSKFHAITPETRIFEVGSGSGWFEVLCALRGLNCSAIELSPVNLDVAQRLAAKHDVEVDIRLGNIETDSIGVEQYDYVIAASVFEHVRHYGLGLARVYEALRPGGVLYFSSTNKFSPRSGEFPGFPLYGWWPYRARERIRVEVHLPRLAQALSQPGVQARI
jgi:2-polyprenyl-3-methyl-5-hydroxy-6-metoxy-1,4-benzoquinol methylase